MKITEQCAEIFKEAIKKFDAKAIRLYTKPSDCGHGRLVAIEVTNDDLRIVDFNGLPVAISEKDEKYFENIVFDADNGKIYVNEEGGCCCCDHDDCDCEEGCCGQCNHQG